MVDFYNFAICCVLLIASLIAWLLYGIQSQLKASSHPGPQPGNTPGPTTGVSPAANDATNHKTPRRSLPLWLACALLLLDPLVFRIILQWEYSPYLRRVAISEWTITTFFSITAIGIVACFWIDHRTVLAQQKHRMHIDAIERLNVTDEGRNRVLRAIALQTADVQPRKDLVQ